MKTAYYIVIIACICLVRAQANVPSFAVSAASDAIYPVTTSDYFNLNLASFDDIIVHFAKNNSASTTVERIHIRKRDANGFYQLLHDLDNTWGGENPVTNGKWLTMVGATSSAFISRFDENLTLVNGTELGTIPIVGGFYPDDTFVYFNSKTSSIRTLEYVNGAWEILVDAQPIDYPASILGQATTIEDYYLTLEATNPSIVHIYQRQANRTWIEVDSIHNISQDYVSRSGITLYDGADTVVMATAAYNTESGFPDATGLLTIYKKTSGQWSLQHQFNLLDFGVTGAGDAGESLTMPDRNTILYGIPWTANRTEGSIDPSSFPLGKVFVLHRNAQSGQWEISGSLYSNDKVLFGYSVFANKYDYIVTGLDPDTYAATFYTIPRCFASPINVTCAALTLDDDCEFDPNTLYTVNNPECGATTATVKELTVVDSNKLSVDVDFARYGKTTTCTAQITCPAPPSAPVAVNVPVAQTPSKKTSSGAFDSIFGLGALISLVSAMIL